ncbi:MAG: class I SAM-dependent methyltransferase [Anaerolineales bacterium]
MNSYRRLCTEFYDIDKPRPPDDAYAFYRGRAEQVKGPILEPMCGSGRFLLPLLAAGFDIDGMDASPEMLQACRLKAEARGLAPRLYEQFLHELELPRRYELVMIPGGSFGLVIEPALVKESLRRLHAHMSPGGTLILAIERLMPDQPEEEPWGGRWVQRSDGARIVISRLTQFSAEERISHSVHRYELIKDGQLLETEWEELDLRLYEAGEFTALLEATGFTGIQMHGGYDLKPLEAVDDTIIYECRRA